MLRHLWFSWEKRFHKPVRIHYLRSSYFIILLYYCCVLHTLRLIEQNTAVQRWTSFHVLLRTSKATVLEWETHFSIFLNTSALKNVFIRLCSNVLQGQRQCVIYYYCMSINVFVLPRGGRESALSLSSIVVWLTAECYSASC